MKIISRYKDYYDYLIGIYGIDPLVVYNRTPSTNIDAKDTRIVSYPKIVEFSESLKLHKFVFYICGSPYILFNFNGIFYYTEERLKELCRLLSSRNKGRDSEEIHDIKMVLYIQYGFLEKGYSYRTFNLEYNKKRYVDNCNKKYNCPVILLGGTGLNKVTNKYETTYILNPRLNEFEFNKVIPANNMYLLLTEFLSKKDLDMPRNPKDMNRFESKGFDKKKSFRKRKEV